MVKKEKRLLVSKKERKMERIKMVLCSFALLIGSSCSKVKFDLAVNQALSQIGDIERGR